MSRKIGKRITNVYYLFIALVTTSILVGCANSSTKNVETNNTVKVILDTDFGDDGDDLLSLVMLHYMQDNGECEIVAVGQANSNRESPCAIDVINTYYNRPDIPIGIVSSPLHGHADQYSTFLIEKYPDLYDLNIDSVPTAVDVYRKALAEAEDTSVVFIVIGFKKNMYDLLKSEPDDISPLTGHELFAQKVKFVSDMGGKYPANNDEFTPYNFGKVTGAAEYYIKNCPTPIIFSGVGTGKIQLAKKLRKLNTPTGLAIDYKLSRDGGWGKAIEEFQSAFDCVSTLIAVKEADKYFNLKQGCNELDSLGYNIFSSEKDCNHSYVDCQDKKISFEEVAEIMEEMLIAEPKGVANK